MHICSVAREGYSTTKVQKKNIHSYHNTNKTLHILWNHLLEWIIYSLTSMSPNKECFMPLTTSHYVLAQYQWMYCNSVKQAEDCVQGMSFSETNIQGLVYGLWEFGHSASLEGCFAIQMSDERSSREKMEEREGQRGQKINSSLLITYTMCPHAFGLGRFFMLF